MTRSQFGRQTATFIEEDNGRWLQVKTLSSAATWYAVPMDRGDTYDFDLRPRGVLHQKRTRRDLSRDLRRWLGGGSGGADASTSVDPAIGLRVRVGVGQASAQRQIRALYWVRSTSAGGWSFGAVVGDECDPSERSRLVSELESEFNFRVALLVLLEPGTRRQLPAAGL